MCPRNRCQHGDKHDKNRTRWDRVAEESDGYIPAGEPFSHDT
jgi:hypothetical protein